MSPNHSRDFAPMAQPGVFGGESRLVLESVGTADASALRAIRQLVPGAIQDVARLVYQAPSELTSGLHAAAAEEMQQLLSGLGFRVRVSTPDTALHTGIGEFEIALVIRHVERLPLAIGEAAAFLGTDLPTARRLVCRSPAVLVSNVSEATVDAVRERFRRIDVDIDVSRSSTARYYAAVAVENLGVRRAVLDAIRRITPDAAVAETETALVVEDLDLASAQSLWECLRRTGARASICNRDLERHDVSLTEAPDTPRIREVLAGIGIPDRVMPRMLSALPVIIQQNVSHSTMQSMLDLVAAAGGRAIGLPHSFQRFALVLHSVKDPAETIDTLVAFGDMTEPAARAAVTEGRGGPSGNFTRTAALWLQHVLVTQGTDAEVDLL
jgi:hypothetical protein